LTEIESRQVCVLHCAKAFGERYDCECACFVNATGLDVVKELESGGRRFLWFIVLHPYTPTTDESPENLEHMSLPSVA